MDAIQLTTAARDLLLVLRREHPVPVATGDNGSDWPAIREAEGHGLLNVRPGCQHHTWLISLTEAGQAIHIPDTLVPAAVVAAVKQAEDNLRDALARYALANPAAACRQCALANHLNEALTHTEIAAHALAAEQQERPHG